MKRGSFVNFRMHRPEITRKIFFSSVFFLVVAGGMAQQDFNDSLAQSRNCVTQGAMITLGSWATANIASGFIIASQTQGEAKYEWRMNAYWNFINLGLAGMGYLNLRKALLKKYSLSENLRAQETIEKLYVFNLGLDLVYITGGFYLRERGSNQEKPSSRDQFKGYGTSILIQGGFLLLMDAVMISLHHKNTLRLNDKVRKLELNSAPGGLGMVYHF